MKRLLNKLYLKYYKYACEKKGVWFSKSCTISSDNIFEGNNYISGCVKHSNIGYGTYIMDDCYFTNCKIGRFCSIASGVQMVGRRGHPTNTFISSSPIFCIKEAGIIETFVDSDHYTIIETCTGENSQYSAVIENDVWIGVDAKLIGTITVGNGAIIGAGAVVTKDVPAYAVVVGNPAKVVKYRFTKEQIEKLEKIQWWNWDIDLIRERALEFKNVDKFIETYFSE